ncbi:MAG TPA: TonB-dependent receptor plug domain-containing protein, partial [Gammaproteobacteria bacterium]|nr:TonB-dependent receptor plug domain-containing protein [Gammaproteobacteria bacterium]
MALKPRTQAWLLAGALCAIAPWVALAALADSSGAPNPVQTDPDDSDAPASDPPRRLLAAKPGTKSEAAQLPSISVTAKAPAQSYRVYETSTATGTDTPILDIPQSIQAIPDSVLRDQAAQSLADAVRNAPGIYVQQGEGNRDEFFLRGVKTKSDFFEDGLRDDSLYYRDLYNIEQVDVLQGPAAILFGRGGAGGVINLVTKKPERRPIRNFGFELGSWEHYRGTLDVGGAVGESGAFRFMAMGEDSGGFRDHFFLHRYAANPTFSF